MNFSGKFGPDQNIWYPAMSYRFDENLSDGGFYDRYWSVSPKSEDAYYLYFCGSNSFNDSVVRTSYGTVRAYGQPVRCIKE